MLPVVSYQRERECRASEMSVLEKAVAWRSPYTYYQAYVTAPVDAEPEYIVSADRNILEEEKPEPEQEHGQKQEQVLEQEYGQKQEKGELLVTDYLEEMMQENSHCIQEQLQDGQRLETEENGGMEGESLKMAFQEQKLPCFTYDWSQGWSEDDLRSEFFAVDSSTSMKSEYLELNNLLNKDLTLEDDGDGPQILIYHTHASENFLDSVPGDASTTIVGAGDRLADLLEGYGFRVLHHTGVYDGERDAAYDAALPAIEQILQENPSIQVVIDLHRDEMSGDRKLVMDLQGRPTARFMFFNGLSYSRKKGEIAYLQNPYIADNLAFSFQAQVAANEYYPGIARKIYLKAYRYNMHLCSRSMLIELGAQNNTVEEIMNACEPLAHVLAIVLGKMV